MDPISTLKELGFDVSDEHLSRIKQQEKESLDAILAGDAPDEVKEAMRSYYEDVSAQQTMYNLLLDLGMGDYDYDSGKWTPLSNQVYAFDAEVFDIDNMYTLFLQGVQSIVPDITITDVKEDLSAMTDTMTLPENPMEAPTNGKRSVSFLCNGHPYSVELDSHGDWFNTDMFDFMDSVLAAENCSKALYVITDSFDQMAILIYSTREHAEAVAAAIQIH